MGTKVTVTLDDQLKPDYTVGTELAAAFAIGTTELVVWIGATSDTFGGSYQITGIQRAAELILENGNATPLTTNVTEVIMPAPAYKKDATVVVGGVLVAPTEDDVAVGYGSAFQPSPGVAVTAHIKRALEKYLEQRS